MSDAALDQSNKPTLIGVSSADGKTPVRVKVDPVTGYLLANVVFISPYTTTNPNIKIDENSNQVGTAIDSNGLIRPLLLDPNNAGHLVCKKV